MSKNQKSPNDKLTYPSMANMSAAVGIPLTVLKSAKQAGCSFVEHSRCDLGVFIRWYFSRNLTEDERENWTSRGKRAIALLNEHKLEREKQSALDRTTGIQMMTDVIGQVFCGELDRLSQEMPAALKGKNETDIHAELRRQVVAMKDKLRSSIEYWVKETEDHTNDSPKKVV